ncbi:MAG: hypothetical protein AABZ44_09850 [Elusimicrobiota bacterium]
MRRIFLPSLPIIALLASISAAAPGDSAWLAAEAGGYFGEDKTPVSARPTLKTDRLRETPSYADANTAFAPHQPPAHIYAYRDSRAERFGKNCAYFSGVSLAAIWGVTYGLMTHNVLIGILGGFAGLAAGMLFGAGFGYLAGSIDC